MNDITKVEMPTIKQKKIPPDGGYGWIVMVAYGMSNLMVIPILQTFGLIFNQKFKEINLSGTEISSIINLNSAIGMIFGLFVAPLLKYFGFRKMAVLGGVLFSGGLILTSFGNSYVHFIVTYSVINSIGVGFTTASFSLAINTYFKTRRNRAVGIGMTITALGPIFIPHLITKLLYDYSTQGTAMIMGGLTMHLICLALLLQPVKRYMKEAPAPENEMEPLKDSVSMDDTNNNVCLENGARSKPPNFEVDYDSSDDSSDDNDAHSRVERPLRKFSIVSQSVFGVEQVASLPRTHSLSSQVSKLITASNTAANQGLRRNNSSPITPTQLDSPPKPKRFFESGSTDSVHLGSSMKLFDDVDQKPQPSVRRAQIRSISESFDNWEDSDDSDKHEPPTNPVKPTVSILKRPSIHTTATDIHAEALKVEEVVRAKQKKGCAYQCRIFFKQIVKLFDFGLLRDPIYVNMMLGMAIAIFAEINFSVLTPFILSDMGYATSEIAAFMSSLAITDIIFRFISPFIGDLLRQPPRLMYMYSLVILMVSRAALICTSSFVGIIIVGVFLGMGKGVRTVNLNLVIPNYIPLERLASASGIQMLTNGLLILSLGPCLGLIRDLSGTYVISVIFMNMFTFTALMMWIIEMWYTRNKNKKKVKQAQEVTLSD